jgi:hypothetical protein
VAPEDMAADALDYDPVLRDAAKPLTDQPAQNGGELERTSDRPWLDQNTCHADGDGHCTWEECPQLRDGEPAKSGRHCPLDNFDRGAADQPAQDGEPFQSRVWPWLIHCFGEQIARDGRERSHRFLEEALELVQSTGCTASEAHQLVDYVFGRPVGEPHQETGGVMVTLAALCLAHGLDMHAAGEDELTRVWGKADKIRAKQAAKPAHGPLPGPTEPADAGEASGLDAAERCEHGYPLGACIVCDAPAEAGEADDRLPQWVCDHPGFKRAIRAACQSAEERTRANERERCARIAADEGHKNDRHYKEALTRVAAQLFKDRAFQAHWIAAAIRRTDKDA